MTRLEFIESLRALFPELNIKDTDSRVTFRDFNIIYGSPNIKIKGKIPYDLAKAIFAKCPCEKLDIKTGQIGTSFCPDAFFTDDLYNYELNRNIPNESINAKCTRLDKERQNLERRPNVQKFIETYRIGTKEGLIAIIKEIKAYYSPKKRTEKAKKNDIAQTTNKVNTEIINKINPHNSNYLWMRKSINFSEYLQGLTRTNNTPALQEFRRALDEFDRSVNPFMENDLPVDEIVQDLNGVRVSVWPFRYEDEYKDAIQYYTISLENEEKNASVKFDVNPAGFSYYGLFEIEKGVFLSAYHYYSYDSKKNNKGEIFNIHYFSTNTPDESEISFNITYGTIEINNKGPRPATDLQIATLYLELVKATNLAADLTINNLSRNRVPK